MKRITPIVLLAILTACGQSKQTKIEEARKEYAHARKMSKEYYKAGDSEKFLYWMKQELYAGAKLDSLRQDLVAQ